MDETEQKLGNALKSFKEESYRVSDLSGPEQKAFLQLTQLVEKALAGFAFSGQPAKEKSSAGGSPDEVSMWGIPLLKDDRSDVVLLKFLRARDFRVEDAFTMLENTIHWRRSFQIDSLIDERLGDDLEKVVFMHGHDREGHPVCYNVFEEFQNKELYEKTFGDEDKRARFLRWRVQFTEKSIRIENGGLSVHHRDHNPEFTISSSKYDRKAWDDRANSGNHRTRGMCYCPGTPCGRSGGVLQDLSLSLLPKANIQLLSTRRGR